MNALTLADLLAGILGVALTAYALTGGADYGGGVWDLLASGPRAARQRALIADAIAPIWEANHVWLILVVVILFTAFPAAFAMLSIGLHLPLTVLLVGIVLRGSAFTFRAYDSRRDDVQRRWSRVFAVASVIAPIVLGICVGAVASGRLEPPGAASFSARFVTPWLTPFALGVGVLALLMFAYLAAVYLAYAAPDAELRDDFRRRAMLAALAVALAGAGVLLLVPGESSLAARLLGHPLGLTLVVVAASSAGLAAWALATDRLALARVAAAGQVAAMLWGWLFAQHPWLVPGRLTIAAAAAPERTLRLLVVVLGVGAVVLLPSLWYLFRVFGRGRGRGGRGSGV